jgi:hypothetical protein
MLLLALLLAQPIPPPMPVDEEPSALACTFQTALAGSHCVYEAAAAPGAAKANSKLAADAGLRSCAVESRGEDALRKDCEKAVADASLGPTCAIAARLADDKGRLTEQAADCVEAVREAVGRTTRAAAISLECCNCLSAARCAVSGSQCRRELADLAPGAALKSCLARSCQDACAFAAPPAAGKAGKDLPPDFAGKDKI